MSKYDSQRDEVLDALAANGWATASDGEVNDYGQWFAYMVNDVQDVALNNPEFVSVFESLEFGFELTAELSAELVGAYVLTTSDSGAVTVWKARSAADAKHIYGQLEASYNGWLDAREV